MCFLLSAPQLYGSREGEEPVTTELLELSLGVVTGADPVYVIIVTALSPWHFCGICGLCSKVEEVSGGVGGADLHISHFPT